MVAPDGGNQCVVVDPGYGIEHKLSDAFSEYAVEPAAILVTHGHIDHICGVPGLVDDQNVPVYIGGADAYRLADPIGTLSPDLAGVLASLADGWREPPDVRHISAPRLQLDVAGLSFEAIHAPGHTQGATLYRVADDHHDVLLTGDVLFAGTIGRTDLPGGDVDQMADTLRWIATPEFEGGLPDTVEVLPGHGEPSTLGRERTSNPYLTQ